MRYPDRALRHKVFLLWIFIPILLMPVFPASATSQQEVLIILDPGHGGEDTGVIGAGGLTEKDVCLDLVVRIKKRIDERLGYPVFLTRSRDIPISLSERASQANNHLGSVFVSIHIAGFPDQSLRGYGVYFFDPVQMLSYPGQKVSHQLPLWDAQQLPYLESSRGLARLMHHAFQNGLSDRHDLGMHAAPIYPFGSLAMPAVLIEPATLTNPIQEDLLREDTFKEKIAESIFLGIDEWIRSVYSGEDHETNR